jgi:hypothetical protein
VLGLNLAARIMINAKKLKRKLEKRMAFKAQREESL